MIMLLMMMSIMIMINNDQVSRSCQADGRGLTRMMIMKMLLLMILRKMVMSVNRWVLDHREGNFFHCPSQRPELLVWPGLITLQSWTWRILSNVHPHPIFTKPIFNQPIFTEPILIWPIFTESVCIFTEPIFTHSLFTLSTCWPLALVQRSLVNHVFTHSIILTS